MKTEPITFNVVVEMLQSGHARQRIENAIKGFPSMFPEVIALQGVQQTPDHHPEGDAFEHTMRVIGNLPKGADARLCLAALYHDIGKAKTVQVKPDGKIVFPGHAQVGAEMAVQIVGQRMKMDYQTTEDVFTLIDKHMDFFNTMAMRRSKLHRFVTQPLFPLLLELHRLDKLGGSGDMKYYDFCKQAMEEFTKETQTI